MVPVTHRRPATPLARFPTGSGWLAVVATAALLVVLAVLLPPSPPTLGALSIENTGDRAVVLGVRAVDDGATLPLGQVPARGGATFHQVLDLGDELMVVLRYGGVSAGEVRVRRDELVDGWRVPEAISAHFTGG
jgi:hypothetical protein